MLGRLATQGHRVFASSSEAEARSPKPISKKAGSVNLDKGKAKTYREQLSRREVFKLGLGAALLPCGCPRPASADGGGGPYWDYSLDYGPAHWGGLCALGRAQSPVDLPIFKSVSGAAKLDFRLDYSRGAKLSVINTAHGNFNVKIPPGNFARVGGRKLELVQYHFHTPSEHSYNGRREAMEAHLVHKDTETGELAVLGVLLQRGAFQRLPSLDLAMELAPPLYNPREQQESKQIGPIDLASILGDMLPSVGNRGHFEHYVGSLTTPPCSESVQWYVSTVFAGVTDAQILDFMTATNAGKGFQINARPTQDFRNDDFKLDVL